MPAIKGIYLQHPLSLVSGIWIDTVDRGILGLSTSRFPSVGSLSREEYNLLITSTLQELFEERAEWPTSRVAENGCRIQGDEYIRRLLTVNIQMDSLLLLSVKSIEVTDSASRVIRV